MQDFSQFIKAEVRCSWNYQTHGWEAHTGQQTICGNPSHGIYACCQCRSGNNPWRWSCLLVPARLKSLHMPGCELTARVCGPFLPPLPPWCMQGGATSYTNTPTVGWLWWCYNENSHDTGGIVSDAASRHASTSTLQ
jgi:hypothetical protein